MKSSILLAVLFLTQVATWYNFVDKEANISILFPAKPELKESIIDTDIGEIMIQSAYCISNIDSTDNSLYLLNYYPIDQIIFFGDSAITKLEYLEEALNNIKANLKAELLYSNIERNKTCPSIVYRLEIEDGNKVMKGNLVLSGDYFYSLQVFSDRKHSLNKNMDKFIESFVYEKCD